MARWQYQQKAEPVRFPSDVVTLTQSNPTFFKKPNLIAAIQAGSFFIGEPIKTILLDKWLPVYPSRLDRLRKIYNIDWTSIDPDFAAIPLNPTSALEPYFRRYLQDTLNVGTIGPLVTPNSGTETSDTIDIRRYLQDTL